MKRKVNKIKMDLRAALEHDPAAKSALEIVLTYNGFHALVLYRVAHFFHVRGFRLLARMISSVGRFFTGIEIHPGAKIGYGVFIDHGAGVVIGETAEVKSGVVIYQGVTLGGTGNETGKRHPTLGYNVIVGVGAAVLGNITVGGTGKTPMAEMVIAYMSQMHNVALLSRGYGRRTKGYLEVRADSHYRDAGDEPLQIKLKFPDTVVAVCEKRSEGIRRICAEHPEVDLIVMDDGFQHRYVEPKINIVMIDATRPVQHDRMLPVGTLRDLPEELHRAHYFVVTKCPERMAPIDRRILRKVLIQVAYQRVYFTRFESFMPQPLYAEEASGEPLAQGRPVIALSGIGNPKPFVQTLRERYEVVAEMTLDDHHVYKVRDMNALAALLEKHPGAVIVTTEKDAVKMTNRAKIPAQVRSNLYYLPINISFIEDSATDFLQKLEEDVRGN